MVAAQSPRSLSGVGFAGVSSVRPRQTLDAIVETDLTDSLRVQKYYHSPFVMRLFRGAMRLPRVCCAFAIRLPRVCMRVPCGCHTFCHAFAACLPYVCLGCASRLLCICFWRRWVIEKFSGERMAPQMAHVR